MTDSTRYLGHDPRCFFGRDRTPAPIDPAHPFGLDAPDYCPACRAAGRPRHLCQADAESLSWPGMFHPVIAGYACEYGHTWTRRWPVTVLND